MNADLKSNTCLLACLLQADQSILTESNVYFKPLAPIQSKNSAESTSNTAYVKRFEHRWQRTLRNLGYEHFSATCN